MSSRDASTERKKNAKSRRAATKRAVPMPLRTLESLTRRSAAKRGNVLNAAWQLFAEHGFDDTSMRNLASKAGVSTATIYAHFPTKPDLLQALIEQRWQQALADLLGRAAAVKDPFERLLAGITGLNRAIAADPLLRQLLVAPRRVGDAQAEARLGPIEDRMDERCSAAIREAVAAGQLECEDSKALAVLIRVSMQGWLLTESKRARPMTEERVTAALVALLRGAQPKRAQRRR
jgi:AcrR family transcriptional regulator